MLLFGGGSGLYANMPMQNRFSTLENGSNGSQSKPRRAFPSKILRLLLLFLVLGIGITFYSIRVTRSFGVQDLVSFTARGFGGCFEEATSISKWIRPLSSLIHTMSDEELFWRASFVPQIKRYPFKRVPKIAFMFLTRGPLPLYPLWEKFLSGHDEFYSIYIHSLPSYESKYPPTSPFYQRQVPSKVSEWGQMSMCDAERRLIANAMLDISNEWFVLLSESCIPLFNFSIVYKYLMRSRYSFIHSFDDEGPYGRGRYNRSMLPDVKATDWRKGSQWFEVNRKLALIILKDTKYYPKFKEFCKPACYVDEHYFPTMLSIEAPHLLSNRTITFADWSRGGAHPATFGMPDITDAFIKKLIEGHSCDYNGHTSSICFLFARKFAPSTLQPLLYLAPKLLGYG